MNTMGAAAAKTDQAWGPMLEVAAREVFELMLSCKLTVPDMVTAEMPEITAMVGLAGQMCGVLSIRCSNQSAALMASKMLGVEPDKVGSEVTDAFGEVCNMIAGNFKNKISGLGDGCMLSVPTVVTGNDYCLHSLSNSPAVEVSLVFESMLLVVSLQVHS
ncbi:MAG: chemotaxis protein CheX [Candidatus Sulfotelmatobacter sp.]